MEDYYYKNPEDVERYIEWLFNHNQETSIIIVATHNNRVIGFIAGDRYYYDKQEEDYVINLHELVVISEYRGLGIATHLINEFIAISRRKNKKQGRKVNGVILWVGKDNHRAQKLYKNLGFTYQTKVGKWLKMMMKL